MENVLNKLIGKVSFQASYQTSRQAADGSTISTSSQISSVGVPPRPVPPLNSIPPIEPIQPLDALASIKPIAPLEPMKSLEPLNPNRDIKSYFRSSYVDDNGDIVTTEKFSRFDDEK